MAKRSINKQLLSNYLRHADGHNKIQEEQEMWRVRSLELKRERIFDDWERKIRQPPFVRGRLVSDILDNDSRGYSGSTSPSSPDRSHSPADIRGESRDLCKRLMRQDERDPFRWGHAGFKELYPDEFVSSEEERNGEGKSESEKRKERKSQSRKRKREHKDKRKTKRRKLKKTGEGKSEASSKKKRQKAKKKRRERRRDEEQDSSASDSDSSSDSEVEEHDRKREKKRTSRHKRK